METTTEEICPAMHCPQYKHEHNQGAPGCCYNEDGTSRS